VCAGLRFELRLGLELDTVLLGQRAGERERREDPPLDEDLAHESARPPLLGERGLELLLREEPFLDEQRSERPPGIARAKHRFLIGRVGRKLESQAREGLYDRGVPDFLHTMVRITDPARSRAFYEALGFTFAGDFDIVRDGEVEATNYFFSLGDQESVLELTYNHDGRTYDLGTGYGHIAVGVDDLDATLARLAEQGIEPERPPYSVREGGSRLCFVRDPDEYRIELIERG
jgi:lactoylglutathione lyase